MKESLRLNIPVPCGEDWERMLPEEKGRHCQQCCKTVVDFTEMTDEEVLRYFKERAVEGVCGRFMADQMGRELAPAPVQRNGAKGWQWVVASALVLGKGPEVGKPVKPGVEVRGVVLRNDLAALVDGKEPDTMQTVFMGALPIVGDTRLMIAGDVDTTIVHIQGEIGVDDSVVAMPADTVTAAPNWKMKDRTLSGLVSIARDTTVCTSKPMDTLSRVKMRVKKFVDTMVDVLKDTVAMVLPGFRSGMPAVPVVPESRNTDLLKVYPNPVLHGGVMLLAWRGAAGSYSAAFLNLHGQILQERVIEVGGKGQVDEWALPNGLAAGVYFFRVTERSEGYERGGAWRSRSDEVQRPGEKGYMVEVLVQ